MSEVVNLRLARKRMAREQADLTAAARRAQFGRTKAETEAKALRDDIAKRALDGHRRTPADES